MSLKRAFIIRESVEQGGGYDPAKLDMLARRLAAIIYDYDAVEVRNSDDAMSQVIEACSEAGVEPVPPDNAEDDVLKGPFPPPPAGDTGAP